MLTFHRFGGLWRALCVPFILFVAVVLLAGSTVSPLAADSGTRVYLPVVRVAPPLPVYAWHAFFGSDSFDAPRDVRVDPGGLIYVSGYSNGAWNGPNGEAAREPRAPDYGGVLFAVDASGKYLWHSFTPAGTSMTRDHAGNFYVAGYGDNLLGPQGQSGRYACGVMDAVVAKYDPTGHYLWHTCLGGLKEDYLQAIALAPDGTIVAAGQSIASWSGPNGQAPLHSFTPGASSPGEDIFVFKLSANGDYLWHTFYGSDSREWVAGAAVGKDGSIYVAGMAHPFPAENATPPLNPGAAGFSNLAAFKLTPDGAHVWRTFYGRAGLGYNHAYGVVLDPEENLYITGQVGGEWSGPHGEAPLHAFNALWDVALLKLTSSGQYLWHTFYGGPGNDLYPRVAVGAGGTAYLTLTSDAPWVGDGGLAPLRPHSGGFDIAVMGLGSSGRYLWHTFYGGSTWELGHAVALDPALGLIVAGRSDGSWLGDGGASPNYPLPAPGTGDFTVMRFGNVR